MNPDEKECVLGCCGCILGFIEIVKSAVKVKMRKMFCQCSFCYLFAKNNRLYRNIIYLVGKKNNKFYNYALKPM